MEGRARNSILDFETLSSDFQELLNGSGLTGLFWGAVDSFAGIRLLHKRVLGSVLRDLKTNKTSRQKRVQLAGLLLVTLIRILSLNAN